MSRDKKKGSGKSLYILGKKKEGAVRGGGKWAGHWGGGVLILKNKEARAG
jgi:hypothetical protein